MVMWLSREPNQHVKTNVTLDQGFLFEPVVYVRPCKTMPMMQRLQELDIRRSVCDQKDITKEDAEGMWSISPTCEIL